MALLRHAADKQKSLTSTAFIRKVNGDQTLCSGGHNISIRLNAKRQPYFQHPNNHDNAKQTINI